MILTNVRKLLFKLKVYSETVGKKHNPLEFEKIYDDTKSLSVK